VDARPKPPQLADSLRNGQIEVTLESALSLRQKGFFVTSSGRLLANEGEMSIDTVNGVVYQLRFGEVATTAGETKPSGNRYLFVTAVFDPARATKYGGDPVAGERQAKDLSARFANWYYVITNQEFQQLRVKKKDVVAP
jgi:flagellar basal body rod protein FlgG